MTVINYYGFHRKVRAARTTSAECRGFGSSSKGRRAGLRRQLPRRSHVLRLSVRSASPELFSVVFALNLVNPSLGFDLLDLHLLRRLTVRNTITIPPQHHPTHPSINWASPHRPSCCAHRSGSPRACFEPVLNYAVLSQYCGVGIEWWVPRGR